MVIYGKWSLHRYSEAHTRDRRFFSTCWHLRRSSQRAQLYFLQSVALRQGAVHRHTECDCRGGWSCFCKEVWGPQCKLAELGSLISRATASSYQHHSFATALYFYSQVSGLGEKLTPSFAQEVTPGSPEWLRSRRIRRTFARSHLFSTASLEFGNSKFNM